jgi:choline dehydrogenase
MAPSQLGCFLKSDPGLAYPDLQYHCQPLSLDKFGDPLHPFPGFTAAVCNLRPTSRGTVKARSDDVRDGVDIDNKYLSTENDREVAARGLRITREIVMGAMKDYQPSEVLPGLEYSTTSELADAATRVGTSIFHPVGTCKMGSSSDEMAVVTQELKVRGLRNCRVIDASVMPQITSGNTNTPTLAIAERWVEMYTKGR